MISDRLSQIEESLNRLYRQLANKQKTLDAIAPEDKERIRQQIKHLRQDEIQPLEEERRQILTAASDHLKISEPDAEKVVGEIVMGVARLEVQPLSPDLEKILSLLQEIRNRLNESDKSASLKVKGIISTFPPFVGLFIEPEIDIENFWQQYFPTFTRLIKAAAKK